MRILSRMAVLLFAAAASCAALRTHVQEAPVAVLDGNGVTFPAMTVDSGDRVTFLNGDSRLHQIYSPECPELDSTLLRPGESYRSALLTGPKVCHFQDLLAPTAGAYAGTVEVRQTLRDELSIDSPS
jgi:plastocyanin